MYIIKEIEREREKEKDSQPSQTEIEQINKSINLLITINRNN
jgi:hypothetical protein